jgi:7-keto-8-aminopelargonate synthetase-like enzyme
MADSPEHLLESPPGPEVMLDGRRRLYFAGTSYLGLHGHPEVIRAGSEALARFGLHSATSRTGFGTQPPIVDVERLAAELMGCDDAVYFVSGYLSNQVLSAAWRTRCDAVYVDEHAHDSLREAVASVGLPVHSFKHCDPADLAAKLRASLPPRGRPLVASDGVFPVTGRICPVAAYLEVLDEYPGGTLALDDAHATGVLGEHGRGTLEHLGLADGANREASEHAAGVRTLVGSTLSKALGGHGGFVAGSAALVKTLRTAAPCYWAASAPAAPVAAATAAALRLVLADGTLRERLRENVRRLKDALRSLGLAVDDSPVPIVALALGAGNDMRRVQQALLDRDVAIGYFRNYSAAGPEGLLRIAVFANHTPAMIDRLVDELRRVL